MWRLGQRSGDNEEMEEEQLEQKKNQKSVVTKDERQILRTVPNVAEFDSDAEVPNEYGSRKGGPG